MKPLTSQMPTSLFACTPESRGAKEFTVIRDGREVARILPAEGHTVGRFLAVRARRKPVDDAFAADATSANSLLVETVRDPWSV